MKSFDIPSFYRSPIISEIKNLRKIADPRKKDFSPTVLDFGPVQIVLARHFGFCFGVENAIERAYKALEENPGKRIYLISHMIHNPAVNEDLEANGFRFIQDTEGNQLIDWGEIQKDDVVLIPAFGTTLEIEERLNKIGVNLEKYNTTCPFVERVWKKSDKLGKEEYTIIIHGKPGHEETRATFSHSSENAPSIIVRNIEEAKLLAQFINGRRESSDFHKLFKGRYTKGFDPQIHLQRVGVVNQTTMLASETQEIAELFKNEMLSVFKMDNPKEHFADTRDTLCYATNDNQSATFELLEYPADLAIVVGGYSSSNTSHIVELCEKKFTTYFIQDKNEIKDQHTIMHWSVKEGCYNESKNWLPKNGPTKIIITSGASCPDKLVEEVLQTILGYFDNVKPTEEVFEAYRSTHKHQ